MEVPRFGLAVGKIPVRVITCQLSPQIPAPRSFSVASGHFMTKSPFLSGLFLPQIGPELHLHSPRQCYYKGDNGSRWRGNQTSDTPISTVHSLHPTGSILRVAIPLPQEHFPDNLLRITVTLWVSFSHFLYYTTSTFYIYPDKTRSHFTLEKSPEPSEKHFGSSCWALSQPPHSTVLALGLVSLT